MTEEQIQCLLKFLGYYKGAVDGKLGTASTAAIKSFQEAAGLDADGICGKATQSALTDAIAHGVYAKDGIVVSTPTISTGTFWDSIKYFTRAEFVCKCGGKYCNGDTAEMQESLIRCADDMRAYFGKPITVSSGIRCTQHNTNVGGVSNSRHLSGKAMDLCVAGTSNSTVEAYLTKQVNVGTLRYWYNISGSYYHMDVL